MLNMSLGAEATCADDLRNALRDKTGRSALGRHDHIHPMAVKPGLNIDIMVRTGRIRLALSQASCRSEAG